MRKICPMKTTNEKKATDNRLKKVKRPWLREYIQVPGYIMRLKQLTAVEKLVLACIFDHIGKNLTGWPSLTTIARMWTECDGRPQHRTPPGGGRVVDSRVRQPDRVHDREQ